MTATNSATTTRKRPRTTDASTPITHGPNGPNALWTPERPPRDMREFPLGFFKIVPGKTPMSRVEAKQKARDYKKLLFKYLVGKTPQCPAPPTIHGSAVDVVSRPQVVFRGERLIIPSNVAQHFSVIDIKVANRSQLANSTALPAMAFCESARGVTLALDTAVVAQDITIVVENESSSDQTFTAALFGTAAQ